MSAAVVHAHTIIGVNTPKYLLREGYAKTVARKGVDYYELTPSGQMWLQEGVVKHLRRHPSDASQLMESVPGVAASGTSHTPVVVRRRPR